MIPDFCFRKLTKQTTPWFESYLMSLILTHRFDMMMKMSLSQNVSQQNEKKNKETK